MMYRYKSDNLGRRVDKLPSYHNNPKNTHKLHSIVLFLESGTAYNWKVMSKPNNN